MEEEDAADEEQRFSYRQVEENSLRPGLGEDGVELLKRKSLGGLGL